MKLCFKVSSQITNLLTRESFVLTTHSAVAIREHCEQFFQYSAAIHTPKTKADFHQSETLLFVHVSWELQWRKDIVQPYSIVLHRLEMVQRSAARIVMQIRQGDRQSMTTILRQLHWLPVRKRIEYKILVLVHRALYDGTPKYHAALLLQHARRRSLRSAGGLLLEVPKVNLERFGRRAFACAGPTLWNKLPRNIRDNRNLVQYKKELKTFLFST